MKKCSEKNCLGGQAIKPKKIKKNLRITELVDNYFQAYNSARLNEACRLFAQKMLNSQHDVTIGLTLAGAMTPAGMSGIIVSMMEVGFIDFIIATGANLYHDIHFALNYELVKGDFQADDTKLFDLDIVRIYDVFLEEKMLLGTDQYIRELIEDASFPKKEMSTSDLHYLIGKHLLKKSPTPEVSILAQAAKHNVPVYTSSPGDSSLGMEIARYSLEQPDLKFNPSLDVLETTAFVAYAKENGAILVGGGSPKNFYMQTQPMLWQFLNMSRGGHDYFIQITMDSPQWGGLSGATPSEAISWGKINREELQNTVVVYSDSTIAVPILFSYVFDNCNPRKKKELFLKKDLLVEKLKEEYKKKKSNSYI
jgi:deoxyhypusine synthase